MRVLWSQGTAALAQPQCCQSCGFSANSDSIFCGFAFFWRLAGCLFLGLFWLKFACFMQISVLRIAFLSNFMAILLFQFTVKRNFGVFLCIFTHLGLVSFVFAWLFLYLTNLLFFCFFQFSYQTHVVLAFPLIYPFWVCFSNLLACFCKITWHHCLAQG